MSAHSHPGQQQSSPQPLPGVNAIIAVGSGKGGVGKTTLSVNLAIALSKMGYKVGLLDGDVYGPNVPLMLGTNEQPKVMGENQIAPINSHGLKVISVGFLNPGDNSSDRCSGDSSITWSSTFLLEPATSPYP